MEKEQVLFADLIEGKNKNKKITKNLKIESKKEKIRNCKKLLDNSIGDDFKVAQLLTQHAPNFFVPVEQLEPPCTNRGVQDTETFDYNVYLHKDLELSFDWIEFTVKDVLQETMSEYDYIINRSMDLFLRFVCVSILGLPYEDFAADGKGRYGYQYKYSYAYGNISILCGGTAEQGFHVIITGDGCRALFVHTQPETLIENVRAAGGHFGRVDIALDDYDNKYYTVPELQERIKKTEIVSNWKEVTVNTGYSLSDAEYTQHTVYFGSMRSDYYLRVYDKYLEQQQKKSAEELPEGLNGWTRWEMVFRRRKADKIISMLWNANFNLGEIFCSVLSGSMRVVDANVSDTNRSRWPLSEKWVRFIGAVSPLKMTIKEIMSTINRKKEWIEKQVLPSMSLIVESIGGLPWVMRMLAVCYHKMQYTSAQKIVDCSDWHGAQWFHKENEKKRQAKLKQFWEDLNFLFDVAGVY